METTNNTTQTNLPEVTHQFNQAQQIIILNSIQALLDSYGSALLLNSILTAVQQEYIDLKLQEEPSGQLSYSGTVGQFTETMEAFQAVSNLCKEIDQVKVLHAD